MLEPRFRGVLWDLDGTIADTHDLIHHCLEYTLQAHIGRGMDRETWEQWVGVPLRNLFPVAYAHHGLDAPGEGTVASLTHCYRTRLAEVDSTVEMFPGVLETLEALQNRGLRQGIVTTKHEGAALRTLKNLGIEPFFEVVVAGDHCANYKPHPEPFLKGCELITLRPSECAGVGDSTADVLGAKEAGLHAIAALWGAARMETLMDAMPDSVAFVPFDVAEIVSSGVCA